MQKKNGKINHLLACNQSLIESQKIGAGLVLNYSEDTYNNFSLKIKSILKSLHPYY